MKVTKKMRMQGILRVALVIVAGFILYPAKVVHAEEVAVEDVASVIMAKEQEIKGLFDKDILSGSEWYEAVVKSTDGSVVFTKWFSLNDEQWYVTTSGLSNGYYAIDLYRVEGDQISYTDEGQLCESARFVVGDITSTSFVAKETKNEDSGKPEISVALKGLVVPGGTDKVVFVAKNKSGKVVAKKKATKIKEGNYSAAFTAANLKKKAGKYTFTATVIDTNGEETALEASASAELKVAYAKVSAGASDKSAGTFKFKASNIRAIDSIKSVKMRVWCKQSDVKMYSNLKKGADDSYQVVVDVSKHEYHFGTYHSEVIVELKNGAKAVVVSDDYEFVPNNFIRLGETTDKNKKTIWMYNPTESSKIYADVWSQAGKGSDKYTYEVDGNENAIKVTINMKKLEYSGKIFVLFKQKSGSEFVDVKKISFTATDNDISKHGWYYEKASNGKKYKYYYEKGSKVKDLTEILNIKKEKLYIEVNRKCNTVTVFAKDKETGEWNIPVTAFACSVGRAGTPTPTGTYTTDRNHRWKELMGPSWGQYCTHITQGIYFHSVAGRNTTSYNLSAFAYNMLGQAASHGCIRLCVRDAKWIYDHAALGTKVKIFDSSYNGALGKPKTIKIPAGQTWDPTDPAVKK